MHYKKCIRTMVSLEVVGKLSQCTSFNRPLHGPSVASLSASDETRAFYQENLKALRRRGIRPDLQRALESCLRGPAWLIRARRGFARRALRRIYRRDPLG